MFIHGYNCKIDIDDGTFYPAIMDEDGKTIKWHHFDTKGQALAYLHSETSKMAHDRILDEADAELDKFVDDCYNADADRSMML